MCNTIRKQVNNLQQTGSMTKKSGGSAKTVRTPENIKRVRQAMQKSTCLAMSDRWLKRILHLDLHFHLYKIQIVQSLNPGDYQQCIQFYKDMLRKLYYPQTPVNTYPLMIQHWQHKQKHLTYAKQLPTKDLDSLNHYF